MQAAKPEGVKYKQAWFLMDETLERESRLKNARATPHTRGEKAAILVIGNEIMGGVTRDENGHFLIQELRKLGLDTVEVVMIRDDQNKIAETVRRLSDSHKYVFVTGGIGPTHDDVTLPAVAQAFGCGLQTRTEILELLNQHLPNEEINEYHVKMASIPQGSQLIRNTEGPDRWPLIVKNNVYILPGVPQYCKAKFELVRDDLKRDPFFVAKLYINESETSIAQVLQDADHDHKQVDVGSYPIMGNQDYQVVVTLESKDQYALQNALAQVKDGLAPHTIFKVETSAPQWFLHPGSLWSSVLTKAFKKKKQNPQGPSKGPPSDPPLPEAGYR